MIVASIPDNVGKMDLLLICGSHKPQCWIMKTSVRQPMTRAWRSQTVQRAMTNFQVGAAGCGDCHGRKCAVNWQPGGLGNIGRQGVGRRLAASSGASSSGSGQQEKGKVRVDRRGRKKKLYPSSVTPKWLKEAGFSKTDSKAILRAHPRLVGFEEQFDVKSCIKQLREGGLSKGQLKEMIKRGPNSLKQAGRFQETLEFYESYGVTDKEDFLKALVQYPQILSYNLQTNIAPSIKYLQGCGLSDEGTKKILTKCPPILWKSVDSWLKPYVQYFHDAGVSEEKIGKWISSNPFLLMYSYRSKLDIFEEYLKSIGFTKEDVVKIVLTYPQTAGYSVPKMVKPMVEFFLEEGATLAMVRKVIKMHPNLLGLSLENSIRPKFRFIKEIAKSSAEDIFRSPSILTRSLDTRLLFRAAFLKSIGETVADKSLRALFMATNKKFEEMYGSEPVLEYMDAWSKMDMTEKERLVFE